MKFNELEKNLLNEKYQEIKAIKNIGRTKIKHIEKKIYRYQLIKKKYDII